MYPKCLVLHFPDGSTHTLPFKEAKESASGKMNANASGKFFYGDQKFQIGCNFTLCTPKEAK